VDKIRELRIERGLSQAKLAARAGVDPSTINQIERGARNASPLTLRKLAQALDVSLYDLLEGEPHPKAGSPLSAERALAIANPDDFRRVVKNTPTVELEQTALELAKLTKVPTREDLVGNKDNKEAHLRTMANYCISVINVALDSRGVRPPVEHVAMRLDDALTPPEEQQKEERAG